MIRRDHPKMSISQQCKLVSLSRSAFYYTPVGIDAATLEMMKEIDRVFTKYPFFGSRQIAAYLRREGTVAGRHRVRRLMAKMGLEASYKRPRTSQPHPAAPGLSLSAEKDGDRPTEPGLVRRYYLRASQKWLPLPGGHHGLGDAQGAELAAIEYDACRLLHRSAERGHCQTRPA